MRIRVLACLLMLVAVGGAQVVDQQVERRAGREPATAKPKTTPEQLERGRQMLQTAEAAAGGMEGGMRAYALLQIARAYQPQNKKKALELLNDALAATRALDDDDLQVRQRLQEEILQAIVPLAPQRADDLLSQVDPDARGKVLVALLNYYRKNNEMDRALEVIYRIAAEGEAPYDAVGQVMHALPAERDSDAQQLFATALMSFRDHPQRRRLRLGDGDFASLVVRNWKRLPKETVLDAVHEILKQARQSQDGRSTTHPASISLASPSGAVAFNSIYEFRLFQMLPVLRQLDSSEADKLLKEYQDVQTLLGKYPDGMDSVSPPDRGDRGDQGRTSFMVNDGGGSEGRSGSGISGGPGGAPPTALLMQQSARIVADAEKHPQDALANASALSDARVRAETLMGIARALLQKNSSVAKQALEKVSDNVGDLPLQEQIMTVSNSARLYLILEETASARKVIEKGLSFADKAYKQDTNADDPNKALKAYWPSAEAYRSMLSLAARISPAWAMRLANEIPDPDMKAMAQIALAEAWLDVPPGQRTVMSTTKSGSMTMVSRED